MTASPSSAAASSPPPALRPLSWELMSGGLQRLVNFHLGGAIYTLPGIVVQAGVARAFTLLSVSALLTLLVYEYIWRAALRCGQGSLARIASGLLGRRCALVLRLLVVLNALGVIAAYATTIRDIWEASVLTASESSLGLRFLGSPPGLCFAAVLLGGASVTLLLEAKCPGVADWGSLLANAALLVLILALVRLAGHSGAGAEGVAAGPVPSFWAAAVRYGPNLVFAFSSAEYVLRACDVADDEGALLPGLEADTVKWRVRAVGAVSVGISTWLYMVTGLSGAMAFGKDTREDVLSNLTPPSMEFAAVLGVNALSLALSFPVFVEALLLYLQELLRELLPGQFFAARVAPCRWLQPSQPLVASAWVVPAACTLVAVLPGLRHVINLVSSATDYYFMFVLPPLAYLASAWRADGAVGWALAAVGALLAALAAVMGAISFHATLFEE